MIERVSIDNYKCFEDAEVSLGAFNLLLGDNGSGKTGFFEALRVLNALVVHERKLDDVLPASTLTRWKSQPVQSFEVTVRGNGGTYRYRLEVEHDPTRDQRRVQAETLTFDDAPLFTFESGDVQLYRDDFSEGPAYPFDWGRSGLATILPRDDNTRLTWFKKRLQNVHLLRLNPPVMEAESKKETATLSTGMENFVSWYRHVSQERPRKQLLLFEDLEHCLDGFDGLKLSSAGRNTRTMVLSFLHEGTGDGQASPSEYAFDELSDGQRALIGLYAVLRFTIQDDVTLCIDEPENYLGLAEIKPWLLELEVACEDEGAQALLISHHPELIDSLALERGILFHRSGLGPVRTSPVKAEEVGSITVSDLMARGWLHE